MSELVSGNLNIILLLGVVLSLGTLGGRLFQFLKIPQVVGYIIIGIFLGQSGMKLVNTDTVANLKYFSSFALAIIGFLIGGELKIQVIKKYGKQFTWILFLEAITAFVVVSLLVTLVGLILFRDVNLAVSLGLLLGAISSATAPAATTDVLWENKTRGPLTTTVLGLVAMDDGVALLLFAVATSVAGALTGEVTTGFGLSLLHLVYEVGVAIILGSLMGWGLSKLIKGYLEEDKILVFSIGAILLIIGLTQILELDMILSAMSMGFFMSNFAPRRSKVLFSLVEKFAPPIYVLFFVLVGAKLNIWAITGLVAILASVFLVGRTGGKFLGAFLGAKISKAPDTVRRYLPFCLLSQAGVAVGLSIVAGQTFQGDLGNIIVMVVTTSTFIVQLAGPPFVKYAVEKAGEVGLNITEEDLIQKSRAGDMLHPVPPIREDQPVTEILSHFSKYENLIYPVVDRDQKLIGVITIDHLKDTFMASQLSGFLLAHDISIPVPDTCRMDTPAEEVYQLMKKHNLDYMPVIDENNQAVGVVEQRIAQKLFSLKILELRQKAEALG